MAIDIKKWEASRAKRGLNETPKKTTKEIKDFFPATNTVKEVSKYYPSQLQKKPTLKEAAREIVLPKRGFSDEETMAAKPTLKEGAVGTAKAAGEIVQGGGTLLHMLGNKIADITIPGYDAKRTAEVRNRVNEIVSKKLAPKTAGEAKIMRTADIAGFAAAPIKLGKLSTLNKSISAVDNTNDARKLLRSADITDEMIAKNGWDKKAVTAKTPQEVDAFIKEVETASIPKAPIKKTGETPQNLAEVSSVKDEIITRLENQIPIADGKNKVSVLGTPRVEKDVADYITFLKEVPDTTVADLNRGLELLRLSGRKVDDIAEQLKTSGAKLVDTPNQRPGAFDITTLTKTKREALEMFSEKQTPEGLDQLESRTRGQVSWDEAKQTAQKIGWTEEKMINLPVGKAFSDTEMMASRGISKNVDDTLSAMEARLMTLEKGSPEYLTQAQAVAVQRLKAFKLKTVVVGASSEAGRALSSLRANIEKMDFLEKRVAKLFNDPKTPQNVKDYIEKMVSDFTGTPEQFAKLLRDTKKSSILDMMIEFSTAIKLTGIPTHVVNTISGTAMVVMRPIERAIAASINKGETLITGAKQQRFFNDAVNDVMGQATGWKQGGREALNAIMDEDYAWRSRPLDDISLQGPAIKGRAGMNAPSDIALNVAGKVVRLPYRLLGAEDLLIRQPAKMGEFYTAIGRLALDKGYTPGTREYSDFFAATLNNPSAEMVEQITKAADRVTFQDELSPGFAELQNLISGNFKPVRFIVPFFKTIVNLQKRALEYSPMAPLLPSVRTSLKASPEVRADALARMAVGTAVITPLVYEALDGNITLDAPKNPAERDEFFASGKQAYSIKVGDNWIPFNRLSPFSEWFVTAGLLAKAIDNEDEKSIVELTTNTFLGLAANVFDKSFATGLADLMDALRGSDKERENWFNNFVVGSTLPVLSGNISRTVDPTLREVNNLKEAYMARIPGLSDNLPARNDAFGQPITRAGSAIERAISPIIPTPAVENVVRAELESLGVTMGFPTKSAGGFEMTDEQYYEYQQIAGRATYSTLFKLISNPQFQNLPAGQREDAINGVIKKVRTTVRTQVAAEQVIMKEIQDRLEKGGLTSEQAKEKAVDVYEQSKQRNQPAE